MATVSRVEIEHIRAEHVVTYLVAHGWRPEPGVQRGASETTVMIAPLPDDHGRAVRIPVPIRDDATGFYGMIEKVVLYAAAVERRSVDDVVTEMSRVAVDTMWVRIIPRDGSDGIKLQSAPKVFGSVYSLFSYGVSLENHPEAVIGARPPNAQPTAIRDFMLRPAEPKSFAFRVEAIIADAGTTMPGSDETPFPIERRVMSRVLRGLHHCSEASESDGWTNPETEYVSGLNANMCDSLVELNDAAQGANVEFSASLSKRYPVPDDVANRTSVLYTTKMRGLAHTLSERLRASRSEVDGFNATGKVVELRKKASARAIAMARQESLRFGEHGMLFDNDYAVNMKTSGRDGIPRSVYFSLREDDYQRACEAHWRNERVRVTGRLAWRSGKWALDPLRTFEVISGRRR